MQAPSGYGKSLLLLALMHMIDHRGELFVVDNGIAINVHDIDRDEWQNSVVFFREADLSASARLVDLFGEVLKNHLSDLYNQFINNYPVELTELAWNGSDNLVEKKFSPWKMTKNPCFHCQCCRSLFKCAMNEKKH